jgi:uncharacterized membrane protein
VAGYAAGDEVVVTITQGGSGEEPYVAVADRWRVVPLTVLAGLFALSVVVVGGWRGIRALVALGLTIAVIMRIILPLVIQGVPPLPIAVVGASAITAATILLTEGWSRSSLSAILGTTGALAITGLLAAAATAAMGFTYSAGSDLAFLQTQGGAGLDLRGILLAAIILGAVGVLDDVTVTQAVVVDELAERGDLRGRALFGSALDVGRSHIGATVNTLFLAYVGASLPLLVVLLVAQAPPALVYNNEAIAAEIVRTLAGSIGIVAAVPFTTFVAAVLVGPAVARRAGGATDRSGPAGGTAGAPDNLAARESRAAWVPVALVAGVVGLLLAATALLPATQPARPPLPTEPPFGGPAESEPPVASGDPIGSGGPGTGGEPVLVERGEPVPIEVDGAVAGTAAVARWAVTAAGDGRAITVEVAYEAASEWQLDPAAWELLTADGASFPLVADPPLPARLAAGDRLTATLGAEVATSVNPTEAFIAYLAPGGDSIVFLVAVE